MKQEISKFPSFKHFGKEHIINTFTSNECNKSIENRNVLNNLLMEEKINNMLRKQIETEIDGYKIILDFPQQNDCKMEETSLKEVKQIMLTLLKEQTIQDM